MFYSISNKTWMFFLVFICLFITLKSFANDAITIGHSETLYSKVLNEQRTILVHLPDEYDATQNNRYPVLYTLDGAHHFSHMVGTIQRLENEMIVPHIVVAIVTENGKQRFRDFTPSKPKNYKGKNILGEADNFMHFLSSELIPYIDKKYKTQAVRTLAGHSAGGLFSVHTLFLAPDLFQHYIIMSPAVRYNKMALINKIARSLNVRTQLKVFLFMTMANEPGFELSINRLVQVLKKQSPKSLEWQFHEYENESHMSNPSKTFHNAMIEIGKYRGWSVSPELAQQTSKKIKAHFQRLSEKFNQDIKLAEDVITNIGFAAKDQGRLNQAIDLFKLGIFWYPSSSILHDLLASTFVANNELNEALVMQQKAVKFAQVHNSDNLKDLNQHLQNIKNKLEEK
ncbi:alpha/beta hydrolase [Pseudoalteromonas denitrificans]|uniref:Uncharacterized protein n=1 Tax=Pseudoalteromonas denitrificans DSM 6059 TaxID=1123010 RepID=A0A1I1I628_9GAMM|nr:alpha/beta hydrolase-fold protein [Pseudoalteromonas denitrificans]SFC31551.1 hypothetical protein SAMN02745724_01391 [Pseudoalteromonas denitrificans DSM 6059]